MAIDKDYIAKHADYNLGVNNKSIASTRLMNLRFNTYNLEEAKRMLDDAGFPVGSDSSRMT